MLAEVSGFSGRFLCFLHLVFGFLESVEHGLGLVLVLWLGVRT